MIKEESEVRTSNRQIKNHTTSSDFLPFAAKCSLRPEHRPFLTVDDVLLVMDKSSITWERQKERTKV